ncbi:hypothetical protein QUA42_15600 [Microcoleus sp. Pol11C2]|uniref:hypothetical protein n=1 Tax=Microcoleus sp. Pol11C2 TaxID=3055389 RepID=UPI002FD66908
MPVPIVKEPQINQYKRIFLPFNRDNDSIKWQGGIGGKKGNNNDEKNDEKARI